MPDLGVHLLGEQHGIDHVGEEHGDLLAFAFEGAASLEHPLDEMMRCVSARLADPAGIAVGRQPRSTSVAKLLPRRVTRRAAWTIALRLKQRAAAAAKP